jgi:hypothetical protein
MNKRTTLSILQSALGSRHFPCSPPIWAVRRKSARLSFNNKQKLVHRGRPKKKKSQVVHQIRVGIVTRHLSYRWNGLSLSSRSTFPHGHSYALFRNYH